jgi:glutaredoxin-like protein NrdH
MSDQNTTTHPEPSPMSPAATPAQDRAVVVYTMPSCIQCDRTKAWLTRKGVEFNEVDITTDFGGHWFVTKTLGYQQAPVVVIEDPDTADNEASRFNWSGFRPDLLASHLEMIGVRP